VRDPALSEEDGAAGGGLGEQIDPAGGISEEEEP
jgi:hypothetical protein